MGNSSGKPVVFTDEVNLNHFRLLRVVGKGAFGKVRIVERKDSGLTFALKYIRKDEIVRSESVRNIIRERRMLEQLNHPFLCNLRYSFQDVEYLYIVVDLMQGGDLRFHISRKTFTEDAVGFWMAQLACALRYIHEKGIVHRDLKPDNVLLDSDGHVHLADFNVASDFTPGKPLTSKSGTLAYLAPEVYEGRGYSCEVDWWSLGVTFYECIYNKRPFEGGSQESLAQRIIKANPPYPTTIPPVSNPCLHAISSLLEKDKRQRIGAAGFESFTDNPFFRPLDFEALERKEIAPVFVPSAEKTNFDATYDLEELLLEEAPLEARARRQKPREALKDDATQDEIRAEQLHQMIETLFLPFNYTLVSVENGERVHSLAIPTNRSGDDKTAKVSTSRTPKSNMDAHAQPLPYSQSKQTTPSRDRDCPPSRGTPVATRSLTLSPPCSPPLSSPMTAQESPLPSPSHPLSLPIQHHGPPLPERGEHQQQFQQLHRAKSQSRRIANLTSQVPVQSQLPLSVYQHERDRRGIRRERELERQMDREILMDLDMADAYRDRQREHDNRSPPLGSLQQKQQPSQQHGQYNKEYVSKVDLYQHQSQQRIMSRAASAKAQQHDDQWHSSWNDSQKAGSGSLGSAEMSRSSTTAFPYVSTTDDVAEITGKSTGMLGFLNRKRGRDRSPRGESGEGTGVAGEKARGSNQSREGVIRSPEDGKKTATRKGKEKERGVLGKEGARVIVANG